jgi:hypothetical protein
MADSVARLVEVLDAEPLDVLADPLVLLSSSFGGGRNQVVHDHHGVLLIEDLGDPGVDQMVEDLGGEDVVGHRQVHLGNDKLSGRHLVPPRRAGQDLLGKGHTHLGHQSFKRLWRCTFIASTSASGTPPARRNRGIVRRRHR